MNRENDKMVPMVRIEYSIYIDEILVKIVQEDVYGL